MSIQEIVTNIDARIAALKSDIKPLVDAKAALLNGTATSKPEKRPRAKAKAAVSASKTTSAPKADVPQPQPQAQAQAQAPELTAGTRKPTPKQRAARKPAPKRKADPVPAGKLIALLGADDGLTATALAKAAGGNVAQIRVLLKELSDAGQVNRTGERRGTRWHLVTDDDRIAQRAAQLEAQSRRHAKTNGTDKPAAAGTRAKQS